MKLGRKVANGWVPHDCRYQTHLLNLQQEGKISKEMVEQLANEQLMKNYIEQRCAVYLVETSPVWLYLRLQHLHPC